MTDAARVLGITRPARSALLNERASLTSEMALRIEKAFGFQMDTLMRIDTKRRCPSELYGGIVPNANRE